MNLRGYVKFCKCERDLESAWAGIVQGVGKYDLCFWLWALFIAVQLSMVVGDVIAGFIRITGRGEEETSFTPFAFSRSRFLCAGTMVLGRGHGKALRRAWDTYFCCYTLCFCLFLLCVHDGVIGRAF